MITLAPRSNRGDGLQSGYLRLIIVEPQVGAPIRTI
jgi:hypothetical protein